MLELVTTYMVYQKLIDSWHRFRGIGIVYKFAIHLRTNESYKNRDLSKIFLTNSFEEFFEKNFDGTLDNFFDDFFL